MRVFKAGPEWAQDSFPLSAFGADGSDLTTLLFARASVCKFEFEIEEVAIR
jgi:hypothetical protein